MSAVELASEHEPSGWVLAMLGAIADMGADGRRGVYLPDEGCFQVTRTTDDGSQLVLTMTVDYKF